LFCDENKVLLRYEIFKNVIMLLIDRIAKNQIAISFSPEMDVFGVQCLIDYAKYLEATSRSQAKQADIDKLADEINTNWWTGNKHRFLK
jgi:hypothetical protein